MEAKQAWIWIWCQITFFMTLLRWKIPLLACYGHASVQYIRRVSIITMDFFVQVVTNFFFFKFYSSFHSLLYSETQNVNEFFGKFLRQFVWDFMSAFVSIGAGNFLETLFSIVFQIKVFSRHMKLKLSNFFKLFHLFSWSWKEFQKFEIRQFIMLWKIYWFERQSKHCF